MLANYLQYFSTVIFNHEGSVYQRFLEESLPVLGFVLHLITKLKW